MNPRHRLLAARAGYVVIVLIATLADLEFSGDRQAAAARFARALAIPLSWRDVIDGLRNVVLFAGLGSVWVVTSPSGRVRGEIVRATLAGLALSAAVEGLQCFSSVRTASLVDVATNTSGAFAGAVVIAVLLAALSSRRQARSYLGLPTALIAGSYGLVALAEALTPLFNSETRRGIAGGPLDRLRAMLGEALPLTLSAIPFTDLPLFAAAGFLAAMLWAESGRSIRSSWLVLAVGLGAVTVAAHVSHGLFGLPVRWEAAATDSLALGVGAWIARQRLARLSEALRGAMRARAAIVAYASLVVLWAWRPFLPELSGSAIAAQFATQRFVPLSSLAERNDVFSSIHVAQQFLLFFPAGALLAVWPLRLTGRWAHLWPALWFALVVELGHIVILGRYFDLTNVLLSYAGLGMGWIVVRRSGFVPHGEALSAPTRAAKLD